jgi:hypothetical protein
MAKVLAAAVMCLLAASLTLGTAAGLGLRGGALGAGTQAVAACGSTAAATVAYGVNAAGDVTSVALAGLPASCDGASARVVLTAGALTLATVGPAPVSGGVATLAVVPALPTSSAIGLTASQVLLTGP